MDKVDKIKFMLPQLQFTDFWFMVSEELTESLYKIALKYSNDIEKNRLSQTVNELSARLAAIDEANRATEE